MLTESGPDQLLRCPLLPVRSSFPAGGPTAISRQSFHSQLTPQQSALVSCKYVQVSPEIGDPGE